MAAEQKRRKEQIDGYSLLIQRRYLDYIMKIYSERDVRASEICDLLCIAKSTLLRYKKGETPMPFGDFVILAKQLAIQNVSYNDALGRREFPDFVINTSLGEEQLHDTIRPQLNKFIKECVRAGINQSDAVDEIIAFLVDLEKEECGKQILEAYREFRECIKEYNAVFNMLDDDTDAMTQMECVTD